MEANNTPKYGNKSVKISLDRLSVHVKIGTFSIVEEQNCHEQIKQFLCSISCDNSFLELLVKCSMYRRAIIPAIVCLMFDLILYVPSTIFPLNRDGSSWVEPVLS